MPTTKTRAERLTRNAEDRLNEVYGTIRDRFGVGNLYYVLTVDELNITAAKFIGNVFKCLAELDKLGLLCLCFADTTGKVCVGATRKGWQQWEGWKPEMLAEVMESEAGQDWVS
jgi:hypothetical protein